MVWAEETKKCAYCHEVMSIMEAITELGRWYHQDCYIHKTTKEIEDYKKRWIDGTLTKGNKVILLDLVNIRKNIIETRTEFKGFCLQGETELNKNMLTNEPLKRMAFKDTRGLEPLLKDGKPIFEEDKSPSISIKLPKMRPVVEKAPGTKSKQIEMKELPKLLGIPEM
jgi:hypothetical protein